jgi:hypothetical protein
LALRTNLPQAKSGSAFFMQIRVRIQKANRYFADPYGSGSETLLEQSINGGRELSNKKFN